MSTVEETVELMRDLPDELQSEVRDFVRFLRENRGSRTHRKLRQDWAGGLRELRDKYTSLELQKKALETWGD
jgi:LPS O-antigen subunit length determinant protein (WzzB/FepE family)